MQNPHWKFQEIDCSGHYFVTMISNPVMYQTRYWLYERFKKQFAPNKLLTVEVAYGERAFEITEKHNPMHLQLRTKDELWHKENALNVGIQYLSQIKPDWKYVTFIDADVLFNYENFEQKIVHALQHFKVIQPWSKSIDYGPHDEPILVRTSFCHNWVYGIKEKKMPSYYSTQKYFYGHTGYAWSYRREALDDLGGLMDYLILGSGDWSMAYALIGEAESTVPPKLTDNYLKLISDWQDRALKHVAYSIGFVDGGIAHLYHGTRQNRNYYHRNDILRDNKFDPLVDIKKDTYGLWKFDGSQKLKKDILLYFRSRLEDSREL